MTNDIVDETRITGRLPAVDIEITHRREAAAERVTISLVATPSFEAFARAIDANPALAWPWLNPFGPAWLQMIEAAWSPWLAAAAPFLPRRPR